MIASNPSRRRFQKASGPFALGNRQPIPIMAIGSLPVFPISNLSSHGHVNDPYRAASLAPGLHRYTEYPADQRHTGYSDGEHYILDQACDTVNQPVVMWRGM